MSLILSDGCSLYSTSFDHTLGNGQLEFEAKPLNLPSPFDSFSFEPHILGSCNGLLCLGFPNCCILWNPSTKTHHALPSLPDDEMRETNVRYYVFHGLGYDEMHDDFKFIRIRQLIGRSDYEVWVYSLNSNAWKNLGKFPYYVHFGRGMSDVFVNGSLHYFVSKKNNSSAAGGEGGNEDFEYLIAAFNVSSETSQLIPKPKSVNLDKNVELGVLDGCLCMVLNDNDMNFKLFQMKEYANELSWIESFRFEPTDDGLFSMRPITWLLRNQKGKHVVLLEGYGQVFCFDVESGSLKDMIINTADEDTCEFVEICVCMESQRLLDTTDGGSSEFVEA